MQPGETTILRQNDVVKLRSARPGGNRNPQGRAAFVSGEAEAHRERRAEDEAIEARTRGEAPAWWPGMSLAGRPPEAVAWPAEPILAASGVKSTWGRERRRSTRTPGLLLTVNERARLREMIGTAGACGTRWVEVRRMVPEPGGMREERMVTRTYCGTRLCDRCDERRREIEAQRCEGPWKLFVTLGFPHGAMGVRAAWEHVHDWIADITRRIRREAGKRDRLIERRSRAKSDARWLATTPASLPAACEGEFQYAWVIEAHRDGYPHVHLCTTLHYIAAGWLKSEWSRVTNTPVRWMKIKRVYDVQGVCKYLAKYMAKATLKPDILAMLYRRRLWASTLEAGEPEDRGWKPQEGVTSKEAYIAHVTGATGDRAWGWERDGGNEETFTTWSRFWQWRWRDVGVGALAVLEPTSREERDKRLRWAMQDSCQRENNSG